MALAHFGGVQRVREEHRDVRGLPWIEHVIADTRYALRTLRRAPTFTLAATLTLALGIGANAAMFGVVDRLLFRAPAFLQDADRVHRVYLVRTFDGKENFQDNFQYTRYKDLTRWTTSFDVTAAMWDRDMVIGVGQDAREMPVGAVSATYWSLFSVRPLLGRLFTAAEDTTPTGASVAVLSYAFWQSRYGGRPDVIGQRLKVGASDYTIVGVVPQAFTGMSSSRPTAVWIPITTMAAREFTWNPRDPYNWFEKYNIAWMQMLARRKPGVDIRAANADLSNAFRHSYAVQRVQSPGTTVAEIAKPRAIVASLLAERGPAESPVSKVARWVTGVAIMVMLIAAANVANLLLARALRRRREIAVRLALGISRARLMSQLLVESLVLSMLGGVAGLLIAQWGGTILRSQFLPASAPAPVLNDARTLVFAGAAVLLVALLTGLAPALQSGHGDLNSALKSGAREGTYHRSRMRIALLMVQGALSVVLLVGAGLFVRSMNNVRSLRMGYDLDVLLWASVEERGERLTDEQKETLRNRLLETAKSIPGIASASRAVTVPYWMTWNEDLHVSGIDSSVLNAKGPFNIQAATPEIFTTMGTRLIRGRGLAATDTRNAPKVMVVSDAMAKTLWPTIDAIGQCVRIGADTAPCTTVVGIAENIRTQKLSEDRMLYYNLPIHQMTSMGRGGLFLRVANGDAARQGEAVRRHLQRLMPGASYVAVRPMTEIFAPTVRSWRLGATMFVAFGALALVLAAIGLYSVIAYNVAQRTHELGVRVAFGAEVGDILRLVLGEGLRITIVGVLVGGAIALVAGRWVAPLLFNVTPTDPSVFSIVVTIIVATATLASLLPALRAARLDPNTALRTD